MFTGDRSGDFLYRALFENGFASQPESIAVGDGLTLHDAYITAPVRCAPPDNKPTPDEFAKCVPYMERELDLLMRVRVVVVLGKLAFDAYLGILKKRGVIRSRAVALPGGHRPRARHPERASPFCLGCLPSEPAKYFDRKTHPRNAVRTFRPRRCNHSRMIAPVDERNARVVSVTALKVTASPAQIAPTRAATRGSG